VVTAATFTSWQYHGVRIEINPTDESDLRRLAPINQPAFLMLAKRAVRSTPAGAETRPTSLQEFPIALSSWKGCPRFHINCFGVWPPEQHADIEAARDGRVQHIENVLQRSGMRKPDLMNATVTHTLCRAESAASPIRWNAG